MATITPKDILDLITASNRPLTKRDVAQKLKIKGGENRVALKQILKQLVKDSAIVKHDGGAYSIPEGLPGVTIIAVSEITVDGDVFAAPDEWDVQSQGPAPRIEVMPDKKHFPNVTETTRSLARLTKVSAEFYEAHIIKNLDVPENRVLGLLRMQKNGAVLQPADKKARHDFDVMNNDLNGAEDGDLVVGEVTPERGIRNKKARIIEVLGRRDDPKAISLISLYEVGLKDGFPDAVNKATEGLKVPPAKGREDLRDVPLVTIDGADARDFDDAVFAEKLDNGDYHLIVAIADVSYYVRANETLDIEAQSRGNSTYFPDRVVPMLPEALSNDLCSLRPDEDRATLVVHMTIDAHGKLKDYKFTRALIRSHARLIYEQVQAAKDGQTDEKTAPLMDSVINPLYEAFAILDKARQKRGALEIDLPETQILINDAGDMTGVKPRTRLDAHKLIEEFMVLANVAAATALEAKHDATSRLPNCVYRIHDKPSYDKLDSVRDFLGSFELDLPKGQNIQSGQLNGILRQARDMEYKELISIMILRSQSQAVYSVDNIGHYGLALQKYAHFTSPIRRYADLLVHRSLIKAYKLGPTWGKDGLQEEQQARLEEIAGHISGTERNSMVAERNATDRFVAGYLSEQIGAKFEGKISGVTRFGLFIRLNESGADGLVPMRSMKDDFYVHDEKAHALVGKRRGKVFRLGAAVTVKLKEADKMTGSTVLELVDNPNGADIPGMAKPQIPHDSGRNDKPGRDGRKPFKGRRKHKGGAPKGNGSNGQKDNAGAGHYSKKKKKKTTTPKHKRRNKQKKPQN